MATTAIRLVPCYHTFYEGVERLYCLNYANSNGELAATRFVYDKKGVNTMAFYQEISGHRSSRNQHEFDNEGRMVRRIREFNDGEQTIEEFRYGEGGKLLSEQFKSSTGLEGQATYDYDEEGNATGMICDNHKGWLNGSIEFKFDQFGRRQAGTISSRGKVDGSIEYQYGTTGSLIHESWKLGDGWSQTLQFVYEEAR